MYLLIKICMHTYIYIYIIMLYFVVYIYLFIDLSSCMYLGLRYSVYTTLVYVYAY